MTAADWTLVKSVFGRALEIQPGCRESWLNDQDTVDPSVLVEVRRLLAHAPAERAAVKAPARRFGEGECLGERFVLGLFLGRGGMGEVYLAQDLVLHLPVAIKVVREDLASDPVFSARLEQEIRAARRVQHQNVCSLYDLHTDAGGLKYLSMEYLDGQTLAARLSEGPLDLAELTSIAEQLANGLDAIHRAGIVHRDLKSANIFVQPQRAVIADFGLAYDLSRPVTETISLFGPGAIVGTPAYMAPEQLMGQPAGTSADIHAFGVVLYQAATGELPFPGETPLAVALRRLEDKEVPSPRRINPQLSHSWEHAIQECLARNPTKRPESAAAVLELTRQRAPLKISRRAMTGGGAVAAALAGAGLYRWRQPYEPKPEAVYHAKIGSEFMRRTSNREILAAIKELEQAVRIDPRYADGWANLADAYCMAANHVTIPGPEARRKAEAAARNALALDAGQAVGFAALAYVLATDFSRWQDADEPYRKAIAIAPRNPLLRIRYAGYLGRRGRFDEAVRSAETAVSLDPAAFRGMVQLGVELLRARRFREMRDHMLRVVEVHPTDAAGYLSLGRAHEWMREFPQAHAALDTAQRLLDEGDASGFRVTLLCAEGRAAEARRLADPYFAGWQKGKHESNTTAGAEAALRRTGNVFTVIDTAMAKGEDTVLAIPTNPYLEYLKDDVRFVAFRQRVGLA